MSANLRNALETSAADLALRDAVGSAVAAVAAREGVTLDVGQLVELAEQGVVALRDLVMGALDKKVKADADKAVAGITTMEAAEADEREH